jgi:hypothetical protein
MGGTLWCQRTERGVRTFYSILYMQLHLQGIAMPRDTEGKFGPWHVWANHNLVYRWYPLASCYVLAPEPQALCTGGHSFRSCPIAPATRALLCLTPLQVVIGHGGSYDPALLDSIAAALNKAGLQERCGDLYQHLGRSLEALQAYRKAHAYRSDPWPAVCSCDRVATV